jgi:uncharacterized membrane protein YukC
MVYTLVAALVLFLISSVIFFVEAKKAPFVDSKEPFLHDDYYPKKD